VTVAVAAAVAAILAAILAVGSGGGGGVGGVGSPGGWKKVSRAHVIEGELPPAAAAREQPPAATEGNRTHAVDVFAHQPLVTDRGADAVVRRVVVTRSEPVSQAKARTHITL